MKFLNTGILKTYFKIINREFYVDIPLGILIVNFLFQRIFKINGEIKTSVHYGSLIVGADNIKISGIESFKCLAGKGGCYFTAFKGTTLEIGENSIWAFNVCIQTGNHKLENLKEYNLSSVVIGKNCWIGNGAAILAGVTLGDNVVVGANSVVTKSFPSNVVIAGVPAKIIKIL